MTNRSLQSFTAEMQKKEFQTWRYLTPTPLVDPGAVRNGPPWKTSSAKHQKVGWRAMWSSSCSLHFCDVFRDVFFFFFGKKSWHGGAFTCVDCLHVFCRTDIPNMYWIIIFIVIAIFAAWFFCGATSQDHPREPVHFIFRTSELMKRTRFWGGANE